MKVHTFETFSKTYLIDIDKNKSVITNRIKQRLINFNIKKEKCEICGLEEWNNTKIPLEIHHIDGDRWNNKLDNLQLLCPNYHAQTSNYCAKNITVKLQKPKKSKGLVKYGTKRKILRPSYEILINELNNSNYCAMGRKYGVSDNCIKKWILMYEKYGGQANLVKARV